jgi:uncharacterized protein YcbK (DUF882 family)
MTRKIMVGRWFSIYEMSRTSTGLENNPPDEAYANLGRLVHTLLDPLRNDLGQPVRVTSGYRSPAVNKAVGGSRTSRHMLGLAADIKVRRMSSSALADRIEDLREQGVLDYDQVIAYAPSRGGHVHVGLAPEGSIPRRQMLWAPRGGGYEPYSSD